MSSILAWFKRSPFLLLISVQILFYVFVFGFNWFPEHDGSLAFHFIKYLTANLNLSGIPFWIPTRGYGSESGVWILSNYKLGAWALLPFAKLTNLDSVKHYFAAIFIAELFFLTGCYQLSKMIFISQGTRAFVSLVLVGSAVWISSDTFSLHTMYSVPWCMFFMWRGVQKRRLELVLAGYASLFLLVVGNAPYIVIPQVFPCTAFLISVMWLEKVSINDFRINRNALGMLALLGIAIVVPFIIVKFRSYTDFISAGRSSESGGVDIFSFLSYAADDQLQFIGTGFLSGQTGFRDLQSFLGFMTPTMIVTSLAYFFNRKMIPFLSFFVVGFLFYAGSNSFMAPLIFLIPGVSLFRHIGYMALMLKVPLVFIAGFLIDGLNKAPDRKGAAKLAISLFSLHLAFLFAAVSPSTRMAIGVVSLILAGILFFQILRNSEPRREVFTALIALIATIDIYSFKTGESYRRMVRAIPEIEYLFEPRPAEFVPSRETEPFRSQSFAYMAALMSGSSQDFETCLRNDSCPYPNPQKNAAIYATLEDFVNVDNCANVYRMDTLSKSIGELQRIYGRKFSDLYLFAREKSHLGFLQTTACGFPKIQIYTGIAPLDEVGMKNQILSSNSMPALFASSDQLDKSDPTVVRDLSESRWFSNGEAYVKVQNFDTDHIEIKSDLPANERGYWLYYSDAWHPRWQAFVNGAETPIVRANIGFKALKIPGGPATIHMKIRKTDFNLLFGVIWAWSTLITCLLVWFTFHTIRAEVTAKSV